MGHAETRRQHMEALELILRYSPDWLTPTELGHKIGCHRSTIYSYLEEMETYCPILTNGKGGYRIDPTKYLSDVKLSAGEALSIYLALRRFIRQTTHAPDFFISAIRKVAAVLRHPNLSMQLAESSLLLENDEEAIKAHTHVWEMLLRGWLENIAVRFKYQKLRSTEIDEHEFDPYLFEPAVLSHGIYVIGWSHTRQHIRTFKVDRISQISLTTRRFEKPDAISPNELLTHAWGVWYGDNLTKIELLFAPAVASRVLETIWHPSQKTELQPDGSLYWWVEIAGRKELLSWVRGWGEDVCVLGPGDFKEEIAASLRAAAALYEKEQSQADRE